VHVCVCMGVGIFLWDLLKKDAFLLQVTSEGYVCVYACSTIFQGIVLATRLLSW